MMRVLHVIPGLGDGGGAERSLQAMAPHLAAAVDLHVAYFTRRSALRPVLESSGAVVHSLGEGSRLHTLRGLEGVIRSVAPDLIHTTLIDADLVGRMAGARHGTPTVSSLVSLSYGRAQFEGSSPLTNAKRLAIWGADIATARSVIRFHALTNHVASTMSRRLRVPLSRMTVIPRGRDPESLGTRSPERRQLTRRALGVGDQPLVIAAARHERPKGLDVLIQAIPLVLKSIPEARFIVGGRDGLETPRLKQLSERLRLGESVEFIGPRSDVPDLMCAADVWCVPSRWEGFGGILLEAMALEVPVVASDLEAIREVAGPDAPFQLVAPEDPTALASGIISVLQQPDRARQRAVVGRDRFLDNFTVDQTSARTIDLYENALVSARGRRAR